MTDLRKAAEMALEALKGINPGIHMSPMAEESWNKASDALRQALAQPEQHLKFEGPIHVVCQCDKCKAQPEQKYATKVLADGTFVTEPLPLYTAPPKREWVGLTDEEVDEIYMHEGHEDVVLLTQAKLKEKNGG